MNINVDVGFVNNLPAKKVLVANIKDTHFPAHVYDQFDVDMKARLTLQSVLQ